MWVAFTAWTQIEHAHWLSRGEPRSNNNVRRLRQIRRYNKLLPYATSNMAASHGVNTRSKRDPIPLLNSWDVIQCMNTAVGVSCVTLTIHVACVYSPQLVALWSWCINLIWTQLPILKPLEPCNIHDQTTSVRFPHVVPKSLGFCSVALSSTLKFVHSVLNVMWSHSNCTSI